MPRGGGGEVFFKYLLKKTRSFFVKSETDKGHIFKKAEKGSGGAQQTLPCGAACLN